MLRDMLECFIINIQHIITLMAETHMAKEHKRKLVKRTGISTKEPSEGSLTGRFILAALSCGSTCGITHW